MSSFLLGSSVSNGIRYKKLQSDGIWVDCWFWLFYDLRGGLGSWCWGNTRSFFCIFCGEQCLKVGSGADTSCFVERLDNFATIYLL